jgi:hypothetical protein
VAAVAAFTAAVGVGAFMAVVVAAVFIAGAEEDSTAVALPVAVAGSVVAEDIVVAAPTGACAPTVAARDLLVAEALIGAVVFGADRQQAGARTEDSPRVA